LWSTARDGPFEISLNLTMIGMRDVDLHKENGTNLLAFQGPDKSAPGKHVIRCMICVDGREEAGMKSIWDETGP